MFKRTVMAIVLAGAATFALQGSANAGSYGTYDSYDNHQSHDTYDTGYKVTKKTYSCDAYWAKYSHWQGQYDAYHTDKAEHWMNHWYNKWYACAH